MKNFSLTILCLSLIFAANPSYAQSVKTITLKDGSQIKGKLVEVVNSTYIIETEHMGEVQLDDADIVSMTSGAIQPVQQPQQYQLQPNQPAAGWQNIGQGAPGMDQIKGHAQQLLADPEVMAEIGKLLEDPALVQTLSDPSLLNSLLSMDPSTVQDNPKLINLMNNPKMQGLVNKIQDKMNLQPADGQP